MGLVQNAGHGRRARHSLIGQMVNAGLQIVTHSVTLQVIVGS